MKSMRKWILLAFAVAAFIWALPLLVFMFNPSGGSWGSKMEFIKGNVFKPMIGRVASRNADQEYQKICELGRKYLRLPGDLSERQTNWSAEMKEQRFSMVLHENIFPAIATASGEKRYELLKAAGESIGMHADWECLELKQWLALVPAVGWNY
jgi:hypothetical protein